MWMRRLFIVGSVACSLLLTACYSNEEVPVQRASLYDRLGGLPAIEAVVAQFIANVVADDRINGFFASTDAARLQTLLVEQVCQASGGPCTYTGRDMKATHAGMGIKDAEFDALVENLIAALDQFNVPQREKDELLALLGPMRGDIVEN
jgi:hemoglobin